MFDFSQLKIFKKKDEFKASLNEEVLAKLEEFQAILAEIHQDISSTFLKHANPTLMLAGGAIRDTVLGKASLVKDLDIFLSLDFIDHTGENDAITSDDLSKYIAKENIDSLKEQKDSELILKTLIHKLKEKYTIEAIISNQEDMPIVEDNICNSQFEHDYNAKHFNGILKIKHPRIDYPIDLIISYASSEAIIKEIFDFNLCKVYLKHNSKKSKAIDNLNYHASFLKDVDDKTITLPIVKQDLNKVSIEKHLPRLIKKYPDYKIICEYLNEENEILLEKVLFDYKFNLKSKPEYDNDDLNTKQSKSKVKI